MNTTNTDTDTVFARSREEIEGEVATLTRPAYIVTGIDEGGNETGEWRGPGTGGTGGMVKFDSTIPRYPRFVRVFGWDDEHDVSDPAGDVRSPQLYTDEECLDWVGTHVVGVQRESLRIHGREIWVGGACAVLAVIE